jgi:hypothetical protein
MVVTVPPSIDTARSIAAALRRAIRAFPPIESVVSRIVDDPDLNPEDASPSDQEASDSAELTIKPASAKQRPRR